MCVLLTGASCATENAVTIETLLKEMTSRDTVARFPQPAYTNKQASSWDRKSSQGPGNRGWYANNDRSHFLDYEKRPDGRVEHVMMDAQGPGAVVRMWIVSGGNELLDGTLRAYLDGAKEPVIEKTFRDWFNGNLVGEPFAMRLAPGSPRHQQGSNLYLPIPYAKSCKITFEVPDGRKLKPGGAWPKDCLFYNINYRTYKSGATSSGINVESFSLRALERARGALEQAGRTLMNAPDNDGIDRVNHELAGVLRAGTKKSITIRANTAKGGSLRKLGFQLRANDLPQALRSTVLEIRFDGERTVWAPVGDFFGTGYQVRKFKSWYSSVDENGLLRAHWVMPFQRAAAVVVHNLGDQAVELVEAEVGYGGWQWDDRSMYFGSNWHQFSDIKTRPVRDLNYVTLKGRGVYIGDTLTLFDHHKGWWGEGDERIYVDDEPFPSHLGTGTEDYYGYAHCLNQSFSSPFVVQPDGTGNLSAGFTVNSRYRLLDGIPFKASLRLDMELSHWQDTKMDYAPTTFWYGRPGIKSNIEPDIENAMRPVLLE